MTQVFLTGCAGFIGFHLSRRLLEQGVRVHGFDGVTDYYDPALKRARLDILRGYDGFSMTEAMLEDHPALTRAVQDSAPGIILHLAAQVGVRHSLEDPRSYIESNVIGSFNLLEAARENRVRHLLLASSSSVYGAVAELPCKETDKSDRPLSHYAATKLSVESMAHAYAHLRGIPTTIFRFSTVYGPWGRPDMALYKFVDAIENDRPIKLHNGGEMMRDFVFIEDLVEAVLGLIDCPPDKAGGKVLPHDSLSPVAPYRVVNIGNARPVRLLDFVAVIEKAMGKTARRSLLTAQKGEMPATWVDVSLLKALTGYMPSTDYVEGIARFVDWYRNYQAR